jgi:putative transposase
MPNASIQTRNNAAFSITYHLVLVTKYRRKALSVRIRQRCREILSDVLVKWRCELKEDGQQQAAASRVFR